MRVCVDVCVCMSVWMCGCVCMSAWICVCVDVCVWMCGCYLSVKLISLYMLSLDMRHTLNKHPPTHPHTQRSAPLPAGISHDLVRQYLVFHGYAETLGVFDRTAGYAPVCTSDAHTATNDTHAMNDTHTTNDTHGPNDTRAPCGGNAGGEGHDGVHNGEGVEDMGVDGEERQGGGGPAAAAASTSGR